MNTQSNRVSSDAAGQMETRITVDLGRVQIAVAERSSAFLLYSFIGAIINMHARAIR
jgi:hypothetical protein